MKIREIMTRNVLTLEPDYPIDEAARIFGGQVRFRHLPVVKDGIVRGLLTPFDLIGKAGDSARGASISSIMKTNIRTISPHAEAIDAARLMLGEGLGCLPVTEDDGRLVGILTSSDFLRIALALMQADLMPSSGS